MINFKAISRLFLNFLNNKPISGLKPKTQLTSLIKLSIETNKKLWNLEDSARIVKFESKHIIKIKYEIDKNNQIRNDLIRKIDIKIASQLQIVPLNFRKQFYSESPGMIIDRLSILHIKLFVIKNLLVLIKKTSLKKEYKKKEGIVSKQINLLGNFLDFYLDELKHKNIFFEIQRPVKIYNDKRIKKYIKILKKKNS